MSLQQICLIRVGRVVTLALTLLPGLCFVTPASALTAYAPDYDPDKLMLDMATMVHVASPEYTPGGLLDRSPDYDSLTSPVGALSGSPGDASVIVDIGKNVDLPNPTTYYAVTGIIIFEKNNNPCELVLTGRMVDSRYRAEKARILARYKLDKCHNGPLAPLTEWSDAGFDEYREVFLRAVQVCGGHANLWPGGKWSSVWEIKGYKVRGALLSPETGEVTPMPIRDEHQEPNCPDHPSGAMSSGWTGWAACPEGQLMTGLRVHYYSRSRPLAGDAQWFTGFHIRCKEVVLRKPITDPVRD